MPTYRETNQIKIIAGRQQFQVSATTFLSILKLHLVPIHIYQRFLLTFARNKKESNMTIVERHIQWSAFPNNG